MSMDQLYKIVINDDSVGQWISRKIQTNWVKGRWSTIGLINKGKITAGAAYESHNGVNVFFHIAIEKATRKFIEFCYLYPFTQLKCNRVTAMISSANEKALKIAEHIGFKQECVLKGAAPGGDLIVMRITETEFTFGV